MTQTSYFWAGHTTGDATAAPYSDDEFSDFLSMIFSVDRNRQGVINTVNASYSGLLAVTANGEGVSVATGMAFVDGKLFLNDASVNLSSPLGAGVNGTYYTVVRKDFALQTVRLAAVQTLVRTDGTTWDVPLAYCSVTGGINTVTDKRTFFQNFVRHIGGSATNLTSPGSNIYYARILQTTTGAVAWTGVNQTSGSIAVTYPIAYSGYPLVFVDVFAGGNDITHYVTSQTTGFTINWKSTAQYSNITFGWLAWGYLYV